MQCDHRNPHQPKLRPLKYICMYTQRLHIPLLAHHKYLISKKKMPLQYLYCICTHAESTYQQYIHVSSSQTETSHATFMHLRVVLTDSGCAVKKVLLHKDALPTYGVTGICGSSCPRHERMRFLRHYTGITARILHTYKDLYNTHA